MKKITFLSAVLAPLMVLSACNDQTNEPSLTADMVLQGGVVKTDDGFAEAVAIKGEEIIAVGSDKDIQKYIADTTQVVSLDGKTVLPGFHDLHVHPIYGGIMYSGEDKTNCLISQGSSIEQLSATLTECLVHIRPGEWLVGGQWDAATLGDNLHKSSLDKLSTEVPMILNDTSGHSAWANSKALELAGVTADTPNPDGGIIEKDANGEPTGVLRETANGLVRMHVPPPQKDVLEKALTWSLDYMLAHGITSFTEASAGFIAGTQRDMRLYTTLADQGILKQRVRICMNNVAEAGIVGDIGSEAIKMRAKFERDRLKFDCIKIFLDGVPTDSHTAAMLEPYAGTIEGRDDEASRYGLLLVPQEITNQLVTEFDKAGLTVKFHAAGDAAVRSGLKAIAAAREANGMSDIRHNVGHVTFISPDDFAFANSIKATLELSPYLFSPSPINDDITNAIGEERIKRVWPFRDALNAGVLVVPGSDWSVVPSVNPWIAVESMVTREEMGGSEKSFGKPQAITVEEAIDLFTKNGAKHMGWDDRLGSIKEGYLADLIVIDQNPFTAKATDLHKTKVTMTLIAGETEYNADK